METPRLFVGTYAKYNNGSNEGEWLDLDDYNDSEEFLDACAKLHDDESEPEFMFQDYENIPESLYHESMGEKYLDAIYEWIEAQQKIDDWDDSDWLNAHNTYCSESQNSPDDQIFEFDEDFFNTYFEGRPMEAARATNFGEVNWNDDYITFNGYGNLESVSKYNLYDHIDKDAIMADIIENPRYYNL